MLDEAGSLAKRVLLPSALSQGSGNICDSTSPCHIR